MNRFTEGSTAKLRIINKKLELSGVVRNDPPNMIINQIECSALFIPLMHQKQEALLSDFSSNESLPLHATNNTQKHELVLSWLEDFQ